MPNFSTNEIELFMLMFVRITAMLYLFPIFGTKTLPPQYRIGLSFFLTVLLEPVILPSYVGLELHSIIEFFWYIIKEVLVGVSIGYLTLSLFASVGFAGSIIDMQMGFAMLSLPDPVNQGGMVTASGMFLNLILAIVFLVFNGHYFFFLAIEKAFILIPPGHIVYPAETVAHMATATLASIFIVAIRLAAPVLIVLLVTSITLGIIAKAMPQMNIFFVGMPLKIGIGFISLIATLPVVVKIFEAVLQNLYRDIWLLLTQMASG